MSPVPPAGPRKRRSRYARKVPSIPPIALDTAMLNRVLRGSKTQHRYGSDKPCKHRIHDLVPILRKQGSMDEDPLVCHVRVTAIYNQLPEDITDLEAVAEGFKDRAEFHEQRRFRCRQVWVISFELTETPRLLSENPGMARADYTVNPAEAIKGEQEGVAHDEIERLSRLGIEHFATLRERQWQHDQHQRLLEATSRAEDAGVNVMRQLLAIERHIRVMETKARRAA